MYKYKYKYKKKYKTPRRMWDVLSLEHFSTYLATNMMYSE